LLREVAWSGFTAIINMDFMNGVAELLWADEPDSPVLVSKLRKGGQLLVIKRVKYRLLRFKELIYSHIRPCLQVRGGQYWIFNQA